MKLSFFILLAACISWSALHVPLSADAVASSVPETVKDKKEESVKDREADVVKSENEANKPEVIPLDHYLAGKFAETQGDTLNGLRFAEEALKRDPDNKETLASLYRMYVVSGKFEEALNVAGKLVGTKVVEDGSEFSPEMLLALNETKKADYAKAEQYLQSVPKAGFNNLLVPVVRAWIRLSKGEIKAPLDIKDVVADARLVLPHLYLNIAFINDVAGFDNRAQEYYETAVKDENTQPFRAVEALANFYNRKGEHDKRKKLVDAYIAAHGESYLSKELLTPTSGQDSRPLVKNTTDGIAEVFYTIANIFHGVRAPADEIATLHFALYMRPDFPSAQFLLASAHELAGDYSKAINVYKTIDIKSPFFVRGRIRSLYDESEMGAEQVEESLTKLDALAAEMPQDVDALLAKGDILRVRSRYNEAVQAYSSAADRLTTLEKRHWIVFFSRGACLERLGRWEEAEADMKKALSLSQDEPEVLNYLGYSWLTKQINVAEATKMIEKAYEARPEDAHIIDSMGYALYLSGDYISAQEYFQQAIERSPDDATVNDHLGDTYWQLGRKTEARYQWTRALSQEKDAVIKQAISQKLKNGIPVKVAKQTVNEKKELIELPADE